MKQNKTYKILTGLAIVAILTTTVIGSTMANYTTSTDISNKANVAAVGIEVTATDLFKNKYISDVSELAQDDVYSVESENNVVAPGTSNMLTLYLDGNSELMLDANFATTLELNGDWTYHDSTEGKDVFYCPLEFTIDTNSIYGQKTSTTVKGIDYTSAESLVAAISNKLKFSDSFPADITFRKTIPVQISWKWPFSSSEANNAKDTALITKSADSPLALDIKITSQFTQID